MNQGKSGEVTVFISLIMMCMFSLFCVIIESARTAGGRWYVQMAANSALDSVFSQYHRQLWDDYRLLFAEYEDVEELEEEYGAFLNPYITTENWYPLEYELSVAEVERATDEGGLHLEKEVLDYMKYGIWNLDFDVDEAQSLWDSAKEAQTLKEIGENYRGHAKEALKLEKALEAISENIKKQEKKKQEGIHCLAQYDGKGFRRVAKDLIEDLKKMPHLVASYEKQADKLAEKLAESRREFNQKADALSDEVKEMMDKEIQEYESYISEDGKRRQEVVALSGFSALQITFVEEVIAEALEVEQIIEEWEEDEDEEGDGPDLEALWSPVESHFSELPIKILSFAHGVKDKEKEGWLNKVESMYQSGMLSLVLPEGVACSKKQLNLAEAPSKEEMLFTGGRGIGFGDHLLVNEYCGLFFRNYASTENTIKEGPEKRVVDYEMEYLLIGGKSDEENLTGVVTSILAMREGLNLIHILSDTQKREQARTLAMAITGAAAVTPLLLVTTFFVMSIWALGEAIMDIRGLLAGKKVPLIKAKADWSLSIENLLLMGEKGEMGTGGGENGLAYLSWLKILLFVSNIMKQEYRMMDIIQMNLRLIQNGFCMRNGVYQAKITSKIWGKHVFFSIGFVDKYLGKGDYRYEMEIKAERVY